MIGRDRFAMELMRAIALHADGNSEQAFDIIDGLIETNGDALLVAMGLANVVASLARHDGPDDSPCRVELIEPPGAQHGREADAIRDAAALIAAMGNHDGAGAALVLRQSMDRDPDLPVIGFLLTLCAAGARATASGGGDAGA